MDNFKWNFMYVCVWLWIPLHVCVINKNRETLDAILNFIKEKNQGEWSMI